MIVKIKDGKIQSIKIGDIVPDKGEVCIPEDWGSKEIVSRLVDGLFNNIGMEYCINQKNPDEPFSLRRI